MIECVPNVSEGRRSDVVRKLADDMEAAGCRVLDVHRDVDHGRAVITTVGSAAELESGAIALVERAIALIDLSRQRGVHPRFGAVDVIPFIPLAGETMADCVALAHRVGRRIGEDLGVPVFLYEAAARVPTRRNLADVRRGGLTAVAERMRTETWAPDFGPVKPHPTAGLVAVGARGPLVAFNVNLATADVRIARRIAARVREAGGGLHGVKALGFELAHRGVTQVSMNLVDPERTTLLAAFEAVADAARRAGVEVVESEIVGLVPRSALGGATSERIAYSGDLEAVTLEARLAAG